MKNPKQPGNEENMKPRQQTGEEFGSVKSRQKRNPERADVARGSEPETRAAGSRRG